MDGQTEVPRRHSFWFWLAVAGGGFAVLAVILWGLAFAVLRSSGDSAGFDGLGTGSIGVIDINGVILSADTIDNQLERFGRNSSIKAIILHIDSPGGGAAASQEIYHEVLRVRKTYKKRVVASVESVGASGAYYIASASDRIYANQASIVGSIGVIMEWINYGGLMKWAKLENITIKAGALKDAGSPTRPLTPEERAYFQGLTDNMHQQFIHDVAVGRGMPEQKIAELATGQVWTGDQALPLHLIDQTGGFEVALLDTARAAGIHGRPRIVRPQEHRESLLDALIGASSKIPVPGPEAVSSLLQKSPNFYFLWQ
jgi:protease-4